MKLTKERILELEEQNEEQGTDATLIIYVFFLIHILAFGSSGFALAYSSEPSIFFLYIHGGIAITAYISFYKYIFGVDAVRWIFINSAIGIFGIYNELRIVFHYFDKDISDFAWYVHVIPFTYYIMYTFLIYQTILLLGRADKSTTRRTIIEVAYALFTLGIYYAIYRHGLEL